VLGSVCDPSYLPNNGLLPAELIKEKFDVLTSYARLRVDQIKNSWPRLPILVAFAQNHYLPLSNWAALLNGPFRQKELGEQPLAAVLAAVTGGTIKQDGRRGWACSVTSRAVCVVVGCTCRSLGAPFVAVRAEWTAASTDTERDAVVSAVSAFISTTAGADQAILTELLATMLRSLVLGASREHKEATGAVGALFATGTVSHRRILTANAAIPSGGS
jgi:hypothetical protein